MGWTDTLFPWLGHGRYNAAAPLLADGQPAEMQLDAAGRLRVVVEDGAAAAGTPARVLPTETASGGVLASSGKKLLEILGHSQDDEPQYLMLFEANGVPADGATPKQVFRVPASSPCVSFTFYEAPVSYAYGIAWAVSSTGDVLTRASSASFWLEGVILLCPDT